MFAFVLAFILVLTLIFVDWRSAPRDVEQQKKRCHVVKRKILPPPKRRLGRPRKVEALEPGLRLDLAARLEALRPQPDTFDYVVDGGVAVRPAVEGGPARPAIEVIDSGDEAEAVEAGAVAENARAVEDSRLETDQARDN